MGDKKIREVVKEKFCSINWGDFLREELLWAAVGFLMEFASVPLSAAPAGAALAAGLSGTRSLWALIGTIAGALCSGSSGMAVGISSAAIVLAGKLLPDMGKPAIRAAERFFAAGAAVFFSRMAAVELPSELMRVVTAALVSAVFAACLSLLAEGLRVRGFDISDPKRAFVGGITVAGIFFALGALDFPYFNIGRFLLGFGLLWTSSRRGVLWCAALGAAAAAGFCAGSPQVGAGAAIVVLAAVSSGIFAGYGNIARSVGFIFFTAAGVIISDIDSGSWSMLIEAVSAGAAYFALSVIVGKLVPEESIPSTEKDFSDSAVAMMLRERLNFAADAISGIGSGINAAAETLDKKYAVTLESIPERAAESICRSCPNSMNCWGRHYDLFEREFSRLVSELRAGAEPASLMLSAECSNICPSGLDVVKAVETEYSRFLTAKSDERRIRELRRIYVDQLAGVRDILRDMGRLKPEMLSENRSRVAEKRAEEVLRRNGVELPQAFVLTDKRGRMRLEAYGATEPSVQPDYLGAVLSRSLGKELAKPEISGSSGRYRITASEKTALSARIGAYQIPRGSNRVCGDCFESFTDPMGRLCVILSDGMGSGSRARVDSAMVCSVLSKLLKCGISLKVALETVNTVLMIKSSDESFATIDLCRIDLNSGECALYKAGAATTYIKSSDKLVRASLPSQPAGGGGRLSVPAQKFTVKAGDVILMMTDGVAADEKWLSRELSGRCEPRELSERVAKAARVSEYARDDDISVLAVSIIK